jgi:signal peptidase I
MRSSRSIIAVTMVCLAIVIGFWAVFAPAKLGGPVTYSITDGISMRPLLVKNDLAVIRTESSYKVGEVVLYDNQILHKPVLHRIYLIQNGNYFFKGDNNDFVDPGYATRSELVGELWFHVPWVGTVLGWFGKPSHSAVLATSTAIAFVFLASNTAPSRRRRRRRGAPRRGIHAIGFMRGRLHQ